MSKTLVKFAFVSLLLKCKVALNPFQNDGEAADSLWNKLEGKSLENTQVKSDLVKGSTNSAAGATLNLPESQSILASDVSLGLFKHELNYRPVPDVLRPILLPTVLPPTPPPPPAPQVRRLDLLCHLDRIYVRILKSIFTNPDAWKYLKVGTCPVNQATVQHYLFLYPLNSCGVKWKETADSVIYSNTLYYSPVITGPVVREIPFSVIWECHYNKHQRVYKVGFHPIVKEEAVFWRLKAGFVLTPVSEIWIPLAPSQSYTVGQPMYFEAKAPKTQPGNRLYLNKCYLTPSSGPNSTPQYVVLDNHGCMVDSKLSTQTKFYASDEKTTVRFSVGALVFKDMISQPDSKKIMFIHCEMSLANEIPTASAKSCSYNKDTKRWSELYGDDSVCDCCEDSCPAPQPLVGTKVITSNPWEIKQVQMSVGEPEQKS